MPGLLKGLLGLLLLMGLATGVRQAKALRDAVDIPDPNLRWALQLDVDPVPGTFDPLEQGAEIVMASMGQFIMTPDWDPPTPLTNGQLASLTSMGSYWKPIADLTGIEFCSQLKSVYLARCTATDWSPLGKLPALEELDLSECGIQDLSVLPEMPRLRQLTLSSNPIADLTPLRRYPHLEVLTLDHTMVHDLSPLSGLPLQRLSLGGSAVRDLTPLAQVPTLTAFSLHNSPAIDLAPLSALPSLEVLQLSGPELNTASLAPIRSLRTLQLSGDGVTSLDCLVNFPGLRELHVNNTRANDLSPLAGCPLVSELSLLGSFKDLSPIESLVGLEKFTAVSSSVTTLEFLRGKPLKSITLYCDAPYPSVEPIRDLRRLRSLSLGHGTPTYFEARDTTHTEDAAVDIDLAPLREMSLQSIKLDNLRLDPAALAELRPQSIVLSGCQLTRSTPTLYGPSVQYVMFDNLNRESLQQLEFAEAPESLQFNNCDLPELPPGRYKGMTRITFYKCTLGAKARAQLRPLRLRGVDIQLWQS